MKNFLFRVCLFLCPLVILWGTIFWLEGGYSDPFYLRFTTPKQHALILGSSRAAQGLVPTEINKHVKGYYNHSLFNYSFTVTNSAFGPVYLRSIKRKLKDNVTDGLFILSVDPWTISIVGKNINDEREFPESNNYLASIQNVSINPNLHYFLKFYPDQYYNILLRRFRPGNIRLHEDGWLEVSVKMDSSNVRRRTERKLKEYNANALKFKYSAKRFEYLTRTVEMLDSMGTVYLVRLPVDQKMLDIENVMMPDFNEKIASLSSKCNVPYLDMTKENSQYLYTDGNHLYKSSSKEVSDEVAKWIISLRNKQQNLTHE